MDSTKQLLDYAFNSFTKYGIKSVSMDDIANGLGMSKKTIYEKVGSKEQLVMETVMTKIQEDERVVDQIVAESKNAVDEIISVASYVISMLRKMSPTVMFDLQKYYPSAWQYINSGHFDFIEKTIRTNLERGISEGLYKKEIDTKIVSKLYINLTVSIADSDKFPPLEYDRSRLYKEIINYHLSGVLSEQGRIYLNNLEII